MTGTRGIYELKKFDSRLEIRFSSTMDHIDDVCASVTLFLESLGDLFTPHIFSVNLVIREGLTNAVRHGNKNDPEKVVCLRLETDIVIRIRIEDQGDGFNWQQAGCSPMSEAEDHGRGMTIMQTYFSQCRYNQKGNVLYLEKQLSSHS